MARRKDPNLIGKQSFGRRSVTWRKSQDGTLQITEYAAGQPVDIQHYDTYDEAGAAFVEICDRLELDYTNILVERIRAGFHRQQPVGDIERVLAAHQDYQGDIDRVCMSTGIKKKRVLRIIQEYGASTT